MHASSPRARADLQLGGDLVVAREHGVQLVEEEDDAPLGARHLGLDLRDALGERAAARPCRRAREAASISTTMRSSSVATSWPSAMRCASPRTTLVLPTPAGPTRQGQLRVALGEHVERAVDLGLAAEDGIELAAGRGEGEVLAERGERGEALRIELEGGRGMGRRGAVERGAGASGAGAVREGSGAGACAGRRARARARADWRAWQASGGGERELRRGRARGAG